MRLAQPTAGLTALRQVSTLPHPERAGRNPSFFVCATNHIVEWRVAIVFYRIAGGVSDALSAVDSVFYAAGSAARASKYARY